MRGQELAEDQVQMKKKMKMNDEALGEIGVGSFVHMKEDVTMAHMKTWMMKMQREEMENYNEAKCHEEGMHRRAGPALPITNIHANVHNHAQRQCLNG